ncbi:uncharacterized protein LOC143475524 [Brachyhypopomus gauderio]|uniref:uncharacterized protein LOC143475524 n=1 Tax=Brachyhypopomus gauderio TaxID=698409 RepID=UPI0040432D1A
MSGLLYVTFLVITICGNQGGSAAGVISQLESIVRVQTGLSTILQCFVQSDTEFMHFSILWMKMSLNKALVCIATAQSHTDGVQMQEQFQNHSRIKVTWNKSTFNLSFSSVEQTDSGTYLCAAYVYKQFYFGNGTELVVQEHTEALDPTNSDEKKRISQIFESLVPALAATNVASIFVIILLCHLLAKNKSGVPRRDSSAGDSKTDEVNYAAHTYGTQKRRAVEKRASVETSVIYGTSCIILHKMIVSVSVMFCKVHLLLLLYIVLALVPEEGQAVSCINQFIRQITMTVFTLDFHGF